ncbi:MAG: LysM peptidoglycan-binding domain-containing protein [Acidimicrobiales bacterium]
MRKSSAIAMAGALAVASITAACGGDDEPTNAERPEDVTPEVLAESELPPTPTAVPVVIEPEELTYTVEAGDLLGSIAQRFGLTLDELLAANPQITDPNTIQVGDVVTIPEAPDEPAAGESGAEQPAADGGATADSTGTDDDSTIPDN